MFKFSMEAMKGVENDPMLYQPPGTARIKVRMERTTKGFGFAISGGIGSSADKHKEGINISRITPGGPADQAGIKVGDKVISVNGVSVLTVTHSQAVEILMAGGRMVVLDVLRKLPTPAKCDLGSSTVTPMDEDTDDHVNDISMPSPPKTTTEMAPPQQPPSLVLNKQGLRAFNLKNGNNRRRVVKVIRVIPNQSSATQDSPTTQLRELTLKKLTAAAEVAVVKNNQEIYDCPVKEEPIIENAPVEHKTCSPEDTVAINELGSLPEGWEQAVTNGYVYFINHRTKETTWQDPRLSEESNAKNGQSSSVVISNALGPLPDGWEQAYTWKGEIYYMDHETRTTSWIDPRISACFQ